MLNTSSFIELVKEKMNCTYGEIHRRSGAGRQTVSDYKHGRQVIPIDKAEKLCEWANIDPTNVLPDLMAERAKTESLSNAWKKISKQLGTAATCILGLPAMQISIQVFQSLSEQCILC